MTAPSTSTRLPAIDDKALAAIDGEWRTAREIFALVDEGSLGTMRKTLVRLAEEGKVARRYAPHRNGQIARYRRITEVTAGAIPAAQPAGQHDQAQG